MVNCQRFDVDVQLFCLGDIFIEFDVMLLIDLLNSEKLTSWSPFWLRINLQDLCSKYSSFPIDKVSLVEKLMCLPLF